MVHPGEGVAGGVWVDLSCWPWWAELRLGKWWVLTLRAGWGFWFPFLSSVLQAFSLPDCCWPQQRRLGCPGWGSMLTAVNVSPASWAPGAVLWLDSKLPSVQSVLHTLYALFPEEKCSEMRKRKKKKVSPNFKQCTYGWLLAIYTENWFGRLCTLTVFVDILPQRQTSQKCKSFVNMERTLREHLVQPS